MEKSSLHMKNTFWLVKSDPRWLQLSSGTSRPWFGHVRVGRDDFFWFADPNNLIFGEPEQHLIGDFPGLSLKQVISSQNSCFSDGFCPSIAPFLPRYMWCRAVCPRVVWCTKHDGSLELMAHGLLRWPWPDCAALQHCPLELWEMEELFWKVVRGE